MDKSYSALHSCLRIENCDLEEFCPTAESVSVMIEELSFILQREGFNVVSCASHFFQPRAVTIAICLAESHLCLHSWPEEKMVYVDLFACFRSRNPQEPIKRVIEKLEKKIFKGKIVKLDWSER
jgi:S-adenosylmethionine decarboxylase